MPINRRSELVSLIRAQKFLRLLHERRTVSPALVESWDRFYHRYSELIKRFVYRQGVRGIDVDDCVQDVWFYVVRKLRDFRPQRTRLGLRAWMYRIVISVVSNWYRAQKRTAGRTREFRNIEDELIKFENRKRERSSDQSECEAVAGACVIEMRRRTSALNCRVVEMRFLEGRSVNEVAEELGLSPREVWYRQHRTLAKIRRWAGRQNGSDGFFNF